MRCIPQTKIKLQNTKADLNAVEVSRRNYSVLLESLNGMTGKTHGAIAAGSRLTAEAGMEMFRLGGNVFDAVAAAIAAACVAEPSLTSLAGGGFLLAHSCDRRNILFDFFTQTPLQKRPLQEVGFYPVEVNFGVATQEFHIGLGSIAVPGTIAGLHHVQQKLGRLPFKVVLEPAIHYAQSGVPINSFQSYCFSILKPILLASPEMARAMAPQGTLPQSGDILTLPDLANTLIELANHGIESFYHGDMAHQLVKDCQEQGGYLTLEDLSNYRVIERNPLSMNYRGRTLLTNPPPSSGGTLITFALSLLSQVDFTTMPFGSLEHLGILAQVMRLTNLARQEGYDAHLYQPDVAQRFLANDNLVRYTQQLLAGMSANLDTAINKWGSTTHISAMDGEGNAASVTTSSGEGAGYVIPGTGVMMNNMLGEADLHPSGFHQWQENVRISSMMSPTLVLHQHQPEIVTGSGGSNRIRTAVLQVIANILDFQMTVEQAVNSPRVHWEASRFNVEPGFAALATDLPSDSTPFLVDSEWVLWNEQNMFFGGVHTVQRDATGTLAAFGDRRRDGAIAIG